MKRTKQAVPAANTGAIPGDFKGTRGMNLPTGPSRQPNLGTSGKGLAPKPSGGAAISGNDRPSHPQMSGYARVKNASSSAMGSFTPVQNNAMANLHNLSVGQPNPNTAAVATRKPKRKGLGSSFYGEY